MKIIVNSFIVLYLALMVGYTSCCLAPGSYPYAERYEINCSEADLILAIEKFKMENAGYNLPSRAQLKDGRRDENDHWYHVYFYYEKENKIVKTWVRKASERTAIFAFVSINDGLTLGKWKDINNGYSKRENKLQKEKFERLILNEIKKQIH